MRVIQLDGRWWDNYIYTVPLPRRICVYNPRLMIYVSNLWFPRRRRGGGQGKHCICLRTSAFSFLLVILSERIHDASKESDRHGGHRPERDRVTEEDHA